SLRAGRHDLSPVHRRLSLWRGRAVPASALRYADAAAAAPPRPPGLARPHARQGGRGSAGGSPRRRDRARARARERAGASDADAGPEAAALRTQPRALLADRLANPAP